MMACSGLCLTENYFTQHSFVWLGVPQAHTHTQTHTHTMYIYVHAVKRTWSAPKGAPLIQKADGSSSTRATHGCKSGGQTALGSLVSLNQKACLLLLTLRYNISNFASETEFIDLIFSFFFSCAITNSCEEKEVNTYGKMTKKVFFLGDSQD